MASWLSVIRSEPVWATPRINDPVTTTVSVPVEVLASWAKAAEDHNRDRLTRADPFIRPLPIDRLARNAKFVLSNAIRLSPPDCYFLRRWHAWRCRSKGEDPARPAVSKSHASGSGKNFELAACLACWRRLRAFCIS